MVTIDRFDLASAIRQQIKAQEHMERVVLGYTRDSMYTTTLREVLAGLERGEMLNIVGDVE